MFTLLRVSKARANKGIYHTRQNGDFVQELFKKDAVLVYEVTEHNNRFGEKYAFFIIECEEFDNLRCGKTSQTVTIHRSEHEVFYDAVYVSEMCEELLKQDKPLPSKLENLLSDYLPRFFSRIIQWESKGYDSAATWHYYEWILEHMGKKANDFVPQSTIDCFFKEMCSIHDVWQISRILPSKALSVSPEISEAIEKSKKEVQETIEIAKKLLSEKCYKDIKYTVGDIPFVSVYAEDTPCGKIGVHVNLEYEFSVRLAMDNNRGYTTCRLGITKECKEFEKNSIQKITYNQIQEFLDLHRYLSQSELDKLVQKLKAGFNRAVIEKIIAYADNPMLRVQVPVSFKEIKEVVAFDLEEEIALIKYISTTERLIKSNKCNYDNDTIRNLIICGLFTGTRVGELGSIDYTKHIDFKNKNLIVTTTLTKDKNGHVILGDETKTGRYKRLKGKKDIRYIPFALFDSSILTHILENQIKIAKENKYNKNHLLFCQKDGQVISHIGINSIFKRICREAKIKLELDTGFHFHMTRHTAITRLIEMGTDPMVIASWVGHTNTRQIKETYGHILQNFKNWQLENPGQYYKKEDLITKEIKRLLLNL